MNGQQPYAFCKDDWSPIKEEPEPPHITEDQEEPEPSYIKEEQEELWTNQEGEQLPGLEEAEIKLTFKPDPVKNDQQLFVCKEEWGPSMDQEEPEPPHIKEEQEELWTSQEGEQLPGLEETDIKLTFKPDLVKSEYDEDEQSSQLHPTQTENSEPLASTSSGQIITEADGEDCGVSEAASNLDPAGGLEPSSEGQLFSKCKLAQKVNRSFSCTVCKKIFLWECKLKVHMRVHTGEKPFVCTVCNKRFLWKCNLKEHMRVHTGETPFICTVCNKRFLWQCYLERHMSVHTGERPYICTVCKKSYIRQNSLNLHMKSHTGERLPSCTVCGKKFVGRGYLKLHMRIHTGERPFGCIVCKKHFAWKYSLKKHMRTHTGENLLLYSL